MSGVNKLIVSNNQKNKGSVSALKSALVNATVEVPKKKK
jgi:hypothetical protein